MRAAWSFVSLAAVLSLVLLSAGCKPDSPTAQPPKETAVTPEAQPQGNPVVVIDTSEGPIKAELFADKAPISVANFLKYADEKFYDGTIFHRVMKDFMIQGGGFTPDLRQKATHAPIKNEAANGLKNQRGTLAMARTKAVDSAAAQFFINVVDNDSLNYRAPNQDGFGYCVFGQVIEGMNIVDRIRAVPTRTLRPQVEDVPVTPVLIKSVRRVP